MNRLVNQIPDQHIEVDGNSSASSSSVLGNGGSCCSPMFSVERAALSMEYCIMKSLLPPTPEPSILLQPQEQRPRKRRVRFNTSKDANIEDGKKRFMMKTTTTTTKADGSSSSSSSTKASVFGEPLFETLTEEICQELWFQQSEIAHIRTETRNIVLFGHPKSEELAGLERFRNLERSQRKKSANRFVLLAQWKGFDSHFISKISEECSQRAVTEATLQGFRDFCQVYDPLESLFGPQPSSSSSSSPTTTPSPCDYLTTGSSRSYNESLFGDPVVAATSSVLGNEIIGPSPPTPPPVMEDTVIGNKFNKVDSMAILLKRRQKRKLYQQEDEPKMVVGCNSVFSNSNIRNASHYHHRGVDPLLGQRSCSSSKRIQRQRVSY